MKLHEKIDKMFEDGLEGKDFGVYFTDGKHEEITIFSNCEWEVTEEYLYYKDKDEDGLGEVIFPLSQILFVRNI